MSNKISIRFYKDHKVRAIWDEKQNQWWFSVLDEVGAINEQDDHEKNRNYWKYLKAKLKKEQDEVVSDTTQLKLTAADGIQLVSVTHDFKFMVPDGKQRTADAPYDTCVQTLAQNHPNNLANALLNW